MNRKGFTFEQVVIMAIGLFILAVILLAIFTKGGFLIGFFKVFFPDFGVNPEEVTGIALVGIDLTEPEILKFYDGNEFRDVRADGTFLLGDKNISSSEMKQRLLEFYLNTPREGTGRFSASENVELIARGIENSKDGIYILLDEKLMEGKVPESKKEAEAGGNYGLHLDGSWKKERTRDLIIPDGIKVGTKTGFEGLRSLPSYWQAGSSNKVFVWSDQIFIDGRCEKAVELRYTRGSEIVENYRVNKVGNLIFVDLDRPVGPDFNPSCVGAGDVTKYENNYTLRIIFGSSRDSYSWNGSDHNRGWISSEGEWINNRFSFYEGLNEILKKIEGEERINAVLISPKAPLSDELRRLQEAGYEVFDFPESEGIDLSEFLTSRGRMKKTGFWFFRSASIEDIYTRLAKAYNEKAVLASDV